MIALALALASQAQAAKETHFTVPDRFAVDRPSELEGSLLALAFGPDGSAYVGRESEGIVRLADRDGDGKFESVEDFLSAAKDCQGLCVAQGALWAVATIGGKTGIWRVPLSAGSAAGASELAYEFTAGGEHGPHALVAAPDGSLLAVVGNQSAFTDAAAHMQRYWRGDEGRLLAPYMDPLGYGTQVRYPGGFVARLDLHAHTWEFVAVGLRNAYDLALDENGSPFAVDSDMEWDLGLPWYRPVRLLDIREGGDYGSRAGSGVIPSWCPDTVPELLELGRGSPTGSVFGARAKFPERWRAALFSGDWSQGRILALWTGREGSGFPLGSEVFLSADAALPVTDVDVAGDGSLWFLSGGRGARGRIHRVRYEGPIDAPPARSPPRERRTRAWWAEQVRAVEHGKPLEDPGAVYHALESEDPRERAVALRIAMSMGDRSRATALSNGPQVELRSAGMFVLTAGIERVEGTPKALLSFALTNLHLASNEAGATAAGMLGVLRAIELSLLRQGDPPADARELLVSRLVDLFPQADARISGELAVILAHFDDGRALEPLLAEMEKSPQELAIHDCDCVHRMTHGWDAGKRARMLAWFAKSGAYKGGASLPGYLSAMRAHFIAAIPMEACGELARAEGVDAESLALLLARFPQAEAAALFPRLDAALSQLVPQAFGTPEQASKDAALRALATLDAPAVQELARKLARTEGGALEEPWVLLARTPDEQDFDLWLAAIVMPSIGKRECALRALEHIGRAPATADAWRSLLDHAHELGPKRGRELMRMVCAWCARAGGSVTRDQAATPEQFESARLAIEAWYKAKFPEGRGPMEPDALPRWSEAQIAAFLARCAARPGSADLGRAVFESAGCGSCHAVGAAPASDRRGFGPDLAHVADRLTDAEILASIVAPSRVVSDQYRASIAVTKDDRIFEGVVTRRDAEGIEIQPVADAPVRISSDELESLKPSPRSPMPEGALEGRTLEDVRDLFAYLHAGRAGPAASPWSPLFGPAGLPGWDGDSAVWSVRGATLLGRSQGLEKSSYVLAPMPAQDLVVEFDVFLPPGGNSGFCYRAARPADPRASDPTGAQADLGQAYWGSLYVDGRGTVAKPDAAALEPALDRQGWNHVLVRFEGDRHAMELDGVETYSVSEPIPAGALLGFQVHQGKPMQVRIANARWRAP